MSNEKGCNKKKRECKKLNRLKILVGIDLCACGGGHRLKCSGVCRECHTNSKSGQVECLAMYRIEQSEVKEGGSRRPKRSWKYGRQKEGSENKQAKDRRRERRERDYS